MTTTVTITTTQGSNIGHGGQFGDTTYTKLFVGGLAWETQTDTMKDYFQQFGEILEAVVIIDKATGRSKGYGFVTFMEAEAAMKACVEANPVIDGRRANCNLASLGVQKSKPSTPKHGGGGRNTRAMSRFQAGGGLGAAIGSTFQTPATFSHYPIQQGIPFNIYGYLSYSPDYTYATKYYSSVYGEACAQYPMYGTGPAFYPYMNFGEGHGGAAGYTGAAYGIHYPHHLLPGANYSQYATAAPISLSTPPRSGMTMTMALCAPIPHY